MPPKRKATAAAAAVTATENEPPQTRRRTRATTAASANAADNVPVELPPPAKRPRRVAKPKAESTAAVETATALNDAPAATNVARTTRATRARKVEAATEDGQEAGPSVPKKRGRAPKKAPVVEDEETPAEEPAVGRPPLSPVPEKTTQTIPKKRGRPKTREDPPPANTKPAPAVGARTTRARRTRAIAAAVDIGEDTREAEIAQADIDGSPSREPSPIPPKKRGTIKKVAAAAKRPATPPPPPGDDGSDDELLMTPSKRTSARPATPTHTGGNRIGTPRMVMHSVEISTPRRLLNTIRRDVGSPAPRAHIPPLGTPRLPPAFPAVSPQKRAVPASPRPVLPLRRETRSPTPEPSVPLISPVKRRRGQGPRQDGLPKVLPPHLHPLLERQKRTILGALQRPPEIDEIDVYGEDYPPTNTVAYEQLTDLLMGTVTRGEGNSCLLIGPSGSGKTQMVERAIAALPNNPIIVRLSGHAQHNDRLAIREIAWQLAQQTGHSFLPADEEDEGDEDPSNAPAAATAPPQDADDNPFVDPSPGAGTGPGLSVTLPPPAHLLALISMIPTLPRPTIVVLDGFDLFASHARQALLYCLLDTAQACRAGPTTAAAASGPSASGMAVVGVTARVDTINLLEKRVKSRFSGRMLRTAGPARFGHWVALARAVMCAPAEGEVSEEHRAAWRDLWGEAVGTFLGDEAVLEGLRETYALTRDYQMFRRIFTALTLELTPTSPYPTAAKLESAISRQRCPAWFPSLHTLPYPAICLLIASVHAQTSGHDVFTFEMLHEAFKNQVRTSQSAPIQVEGGGIGMVRCSREVLFAAFERLADLRIFLPAAAPGANVGREFALYRSAVDRFAVKKAVETIGQLNLKKWFTKAQ